MRNRYLLRLMLGVALCCGFPHAAIATWNFQRGDCNADGSLDVSDPVALLDELFVGGPLRPCADACDANDDGAKGIVDVIFLLQFLFGSGSPPPPPFAACGDDPTADALDCIGPVGGCGESNRAPTFVSSPPTEGMEGVLYRYAIAAVDPNPEDVLTFSLVDAPVGVSIDPTTGLLLWYPDPTQLGAHAFEVQVSDDGLGLLSAVHSFSVEVLPRLLPHVLLEPPLLPPAAPCQCGGDECPVCRHDRSHPTPMSGVLLFSGEFTAVAEDLRVRGRGLDFVWSRRYRSRLGAATSMGYGWDHSYNIWMETIGPVVVVHDGNGRDDIYLPVADGTFECAGLFRDGRFQSDGSFRITFADGGYWQLHPIDSSSSSGKIDRIVDRVGNTLACNYDSTGRLIGVVDTLGRDITVSYDAAGRVSAVTDFIGRTWSYSYYDGIAAGGSAGDLRSVTTPIVTDTPNGNDFPQGKTTTYTYSTATGDPALDHNLLTVTDPKGQTYLVNQYSSATQAGDLLYDRIVRQQWGDIDDNVDVDYALLVPSSGNEQAVLQVTVNDRIGNVSETFFDVLNRPVIERRYTGTADPDTVTTLTDNRPLDPFRVTDPPFFETRWRWNTDFLTTEIIHPNGNSISQVFESATRPDAPARRRGNLRELKRLPGTHLPVGDSVEIVELFDYDPDHNRVTSHTNARGFVTVHTYDTHGNRIHTAHPDPTVVEDWEYNDSGQCTAHIHPEIQPGYRRRDQKTYYSAGPASGYLAAEIIDVSSLALTRSYQVDAVGNPTVVTDARGNETHFIYNALDQVVRDLSREPLLGGGIRYAREFYYDANDNLVQVDVENRDSSGQRGANTHFSTVLTHETLNQVATETREVDEQLSVTTEHQYDANRNIVLTRFGEATSGAQPENTVEFIYDERNLLYREVRAAAGAFQSSAQYDYDGNENLTVTRQGLEGTARETLNVYDAYDRLLSSTDAMGSVRTRQYDANGNVIREQHDGELIDVEGSADNQRLAERNLSYDSLDRWVVQEIHHFDPKTQDPIGDGLSRLELVYSPSSHVTAVIDDNGHTTTVDYDTAHRRSTITDPLANRVGYSYDANDNVVAVTETGLSDLAQPNQVFTSSYEYDGLDRLTAEVDNVGNRIEWFYDSRGHRVVSSDARRSGSAQSGNLSFFSYDGLGRLTQTTHLLTDDGTGAGATVGAVTTQRTWDASSRLLSEIDASGNATTYSYDPLDRPTTVTHADGTVHFLSFDVHDNIVARLDANGTQVNYDYDLLDRLTETSVFAAPGVCASTTDESFSYDGASRVVLGVDNDTEVVLCYDSMGNIVEDKRTLTPGITERIVSASYDGVGNKLTLTHPSGRVITTTYDPRNRPREIFESGSPVPLASYFYVGERVQRKDYSNGCRAELTYSGVAGVPNPSGNLGFKQLQRVTHCDTVSSSVIADLCFRWDAMGNKIQRQDLTPGSTLTTHDYGYDSVQRMTATVVTESVAGIVRDTLYALDSVGNRTSVTGGALAGAYTQSLAMPTDAPVNQYTSTPWDARIYDDNGNVTSIASTSPPSTRTLRYDHRNQLCEVMIAPSGQLTSFRYDVFGRRVAKSTFGAGPPETTYYSYLGSQVIEEQDMGGASARSYVYGNYVDEVLHMAVGTTSYFFHTDDQHSVVALTDVTGAVVERVEYGDFGEPTLFDSTGSPITASVVGNPYLFVGRRYDPETGYYHFRTRGYDPRAGRFLSRDSIGAWGDPHNHGNAVTYLGNNPQSRLDPYGLGWWKKAKKRIKRSLRRAQEKLSKFGQEVRESAAKLERRSRKSLARVESRTRRSARAELAKVKRGVQREWRETVDTWQSLGDSLSHHHKFWSRMERVARGAWEAGLTGALQGAVFGALGPVGLVAGMTAGFVSGASSGALKSLGEEFLGPNKSDWGFFKTVLYDAPAIIDFANRW